MSAAPLLIAGAPTGARRWRAEVAQRATDFPGGAPDGLRLDFVLAPGRWVDVDTLVGATTQGLRDAGALRPRFAGLDAVVATKRWAAPPSATITGEPAATLCAIRPPGAAVIRADSAEVPRPGNTDAKRRWRDRLAEAWQGREPLTGDVWTDVALGVPGSLFGPLEVVLDALEPVLGRDPRGRDWQEFFPNDDRITWLRVRRTRPSATSLSLAMGSVTTT